MRRWIKFAAEKGGVPVYRSAADWRVDRYDTKKNPQRVFTSERARAYHEYARTHLEPLSQILSVGSGYAENERALHADGYRIIASDIDMSSMGWVKEREPAMPYEYYDPLEGPFRERVQAIISFSVLYTFNREELQRIFANLRDSLHEGGIFIADPGGGQNHPVTLFIDTLQKVEMLVYVVIMKLRGKEVRLIKKKNGYRSTDMEIIRAAEAAGFVHKETRHDDMVTEVFQRTWTGKKLFSQWPLQAIFRRLGTRVPYVRMMRFAVSRSVM